MHPSRFYQVHEIVIHLLCHIIGVLLLILFPSYHNVTLFVCGLRKLTWVISQTSK